MKNFKPWRRRNADVVVSPATLKALHEYSPSSSADILNIRNDVDPVYWSYVDWYLTTSNGRDKLINDKLIISNLLIDWNDFDG